MFGGRSQLYSRLAALAEAGIPIGDAFSRIALSAGGNTRRALNLASQAIQKGASLREAIDATNFFDPFEIELISAGENSGRLPDTFRALAAIYEKKKKNLIAFLFAIAYPVFLMHAAILLPNVATIISKGLGKYLLVVGGELSIIYALFFGPAILYFIGRLTPLAPTMDRVLLSVPFLGSMIKKTEFARSATVLAYLYESGIPIIGAVEQTSRICNNAAIKEVWARAAERMGKDGTLNEAILSEPLVPDILSDFITTGEKSGNLDELLLQAASVLEDEAKNARRILMALITGFAFCLAAGLAAYKIISFYAKLYGNIGKIK
ncbi:MAG: type II secretion system F family protein [Planctomycetota bacterium]|nr:type II secretion system F family protein [Planctomycetota bacterium]